MNILKRFTPVIAVLIIFIGLIAFFNYPVSAEVKRTVIDLPSIEIEGPVRSYGEYESDHMGLEV